MQSITEIQSIGGFFYSLASYTTNAEADERQLIYDNRFGAGF